MRNTLHVGEGDRWMLTIMAKGSQPQDVWEVKMKGTWGDKFFPLNCPSVQQYMHVNISNHNMNVNIICNMYVPFLIYNRKYLVLGSDRKSIFLKNVPAKVRKIFLLDHD